MFDLDRRVCEVNASPLWAGVGQMLVSRVDAPQHQNGNAAAVFRNPITMSADEPTHPDHASKTEHHWSATKPYSSSVERVVARVTNCACQQTGT